MKAVKLVVGIAALFLAACAGIQKQTKIEPLPDISIEGVDSDRVAIGDTRLVKDRKGLRVDGRVTEKRHQAGRYRERGHIDLTVMGPDGIMLSTGTVQIGSWSVSSFNASSKFLARLPSDISPGSKVRLRFHSTNITLNASPHEF